MGKLFDKITSFESLYKAHKQARLGKRGKREVIDFELHLGYNLKRLSNELKSGDYRITEYRVFTVTEPKKREIQATAYRDRVVQHSICDNILMPLLNKRLIYDNCACRVGMGTSFGIKRLRHFMAEHYKKNKNGGYFIKIDVSKYFRSINHELLIEKLKNVIPDEKCTELLAKIITSYEEGPGYGIPMGNQSSQGCALLYLDVVDRYIKEVLRVKHYIRYMDDFLLLVENKKQAQEYFEIICKLIEGQKLRVNPKSQISPIKNGIEFIGWRFYYEENGKIIQKIRRDTKIRTIQNLKHLTFKYRNKPHKIKDSLVSYKGFYMHGNAYSFLKSINKRFNKA